MQPSAQTTAGRAFFRAIQGACFLTTLACTISATAGSLDDLLANSPFLGAKSLDSGPALPANNIELRSILADGQVYAFSVYESSTKKSRWIRLGESGGPIVARQYNAEAETLTVDYNGHPVTLTFKENRFDASGSPVEVAAHTPFSGSPQGAGTKAREVVLPISGGESRRLEKVALVLRARAAALKSQGQ